MKLSQNTAKLQAQIAVDLAQQTLDTYIYENQAKLENGQLLTDRLLQQELDRNEALQRERDAFAQVQFDNGIINQNELQKTLLENQRTYLEEEKTLRKKYTDDQKSIDALSRSTEHEIVLADLQGKLSSEFEVKKAQAKFEYDEQKLQVEQQFADGLITEEQHQQSLALLKKQFSNTNKEIDKAEFDNNNGTPMYKNFFANGGLVNTKASNLNSVQQNLFGNFDIKSITEAVKQGAFEGSQQGSYIGSQQGTTVGSQKGISQLSSGRVMQGNGTL